MFVIPISSRPLYITLIIHPRISLTHPIIGIETFVITIFNYVSSLNVIPITSIYGTGSTPPLENGLHRKILHSAKREPLNAPYFSIASSPYCEQDGK